MHGRDVAHVDYRHAAWAHAERVQRAPDPLGRTHEQAHVMTGAQERLNAMRPDEPGPTRNEHLHDAETAESV